MKSILLTGEMVRSTLAGLKTKTRRPLKPEMPRFGGQQQMTIDPLAIPCPFCEEIIVERSDEDFVTCEVCDIDIPIHEWITGGINALVGQLARSGVEVWKSEDGWTWDGDGEAGKAWQTFEYCVLDAWEKMKMREEEG